MRKIRAIRTERDLAAAVEETLRSDVDLSWKITRAEHLADKTRADAVVHLTVGGKALSFLAEFKLKPTADLIETLSHRAAPKNHPWLLVTPSLSERFVELCRKYGVACLDLNGRVWIRRGTVLVDRAPPSLPAANPSSQPHRSPICFRPRVRESRAHSCLPGHRGAKRSWPQRPASAGPCFPGS
jgi:hypothetical protein